MLPKPCRWSSSSALIEADTEMSRHLEDGAGLAEIVPGVTRLGDDIGQRLTRQRLDWKQLSEEQQQRLGKLGVEPAQRHAGNRLTCGE